MASVLAVIGTVFLWFWTDAAHAHTQTWDEAFSDWHSRADVLVVVVSLGSVYLRGWLRLRRRSARAIGRWDLILYLAGLAAISVALLSPIDALASVLLSMHMVQHLLLLMVAPLLLLLANPFPAILWGLPKQARQPAARLFIRSSLTRHALRALTSMPVSWTLYVVDLWAWHHPLLYQSALSSEWLHDLQHILFFGTAMLFWWPIVNPAPHLHGAISYGFRIAYLVAATLQNTLLGMAISFPEKILYPYYRNVPRLRELSPIDDQALGGGIMWVSGHMYLIPILVLIASKLIHEEETVRRRF